MILLCNSLKIAVGAQEKREWAREELTRPEAMPSSAVYSSAALFCSFHVMGKDTRPHLPRSHVGTPPT